MLIFLLKIFILLLVLVAIAFILLLAYGAMTKYEPKAKESVKCVGNALPILKNQEFSFLIWNIGYGGLSEEIDFFYDGGTVVIPDQKIVEKNVAGIKDTLAAHQAIDFLLLQEIDLGSKRTNFIQQEEIFAQVLPSHNYAIALNFLVKYLPFPFRKPLGQMKSGIITYSRYAAKESVRYQLPGGFAWPKSQYYLRRCFLLQRFLHQNGKELIVINIHKSAYDDGSLKEQEMQFLKNIVIREYEKGNYVLVGGDWNQTPPAFNNRSFQKVGGDYLAQKVVSEDYLPRDWQWIYDPQVATNRKLDKVFDPAKTFTTIIDFFLLSPNLEVIQVKGQEMGFKYSDHQPLLLTIKLKG